MNRVPLFLLYLNVLIVATCGLIYELLAGTLASYLLGDSITQFSLVIGVYLSAMGVGAWLSQYITRQLAASFIEVELAIALLGGASTTLLFISFGTIDWFRLLLFGLVFFIGVLAGLELPLLMRILKEHVDFDDLVSRVLTFDYIGALVASLLFPTLLVPHLGLIRTSLVFGILNALVALWGTFILRPLISSRRTVGLRIRSILTIALLSVGVLKAESLTTYAEEQQLSARIIHAESSTYQRILLTQNSTGFQLFLNGHLQFNSADEYRYHEALVHPAMSAAKAPRKILVLGGGDGLAVREILKYPAVEQVTLVDLDPAMTSLSSRFPPLRELSQRAMEDPRVQIFNEDAFLWVSKDQGKFDVVIIDFPDPTNFSVGKLYTSFFYRHLQKQMTEDTLLAIQCTSPLVAPRSYWCIVNTLEAVGFDVEAYQAAVPTFGVWGFALASLKNGQREPLEHQLAENLLSPLRFLNQQLLTQLFSLPNDVSRLQTEVNRLDNQALIRYYEQEWRRWE